MKAGILVQEYEAIRESLRSLPDHELLTLVGRLATEYVVRKDGADDSVVALGDSVGAGVGVARAVLDAQLAVLNGLIHRPIERR